MSTSRNNPNDSQGQHHSPSPLLGLLLQLVGDMEATGVSLQEGLEEIGTPLGGDLWDLDGSVVEAWVSDGLWWFRPTGARRDAEDSYHGLACARCGGDVQHPVTLPGQGYHLGPFHASCAKEAESELLRRIVTVAEQKEVTP